MNITPTTPVLALSQALIRCPSVTPEDGGTLDLIRQRLQAKQFVCQRLDRNGVGNLWARFGDQAPLVVFAGHVDVVPPGPLDAWRYPPYDATVVDQTLYGRGAADMKGNLAAMILAAEQASTALAATHQGSIALLITADEEGDAQDGTTVVVEHLRAQGIVPDYAIVGEPTSVDCLGDTFKVGRRGSLSFSLTIKGRQGHVAYPALADNPIHKILLPLHQLCQHTFADGDAFFPPTSLQLSNIHAGTGANNVVPGHLEVLGNFRFSAHTTPHALQTLVEATLNQHRLVYDIDWRLSAQPFLNQSTTLPDIMRASIKQITGVDAQASTSGGTSDARFIFTLCPNIVEFGVVNKTIHQVNECVSINDLTTCQSIYFDVLKQLWSSHHARV